MDRTYEEVLAGYVAKFGEKDGFLIQRLSNSSHQLNLQWRVFLFLFCGPKERVEVLNEASGLTTRFLQNLLWDNSILTVRRMTDPEETGRDRDVNVSLAHLVRIAKSKNIEGLDDLYLELLESCKTTRKYASKSIAHSDLLHASGKRPANTNRGETTRAVKAISDFIHQFHSQVLDVHYGMVPITSVHDEQQFLARLYYGNMAVAQARADRIERAKKGDWDALNEKEGPEWLSDLKFRDEPFG